ncbi:hypothetical protein E2C01_101428 [Portunus trituberculatus]|uniref:Uncharacterized protein n=1 Tax=Portunus trituberculatus TaxID=210409 RepID=A0A5B7KEQ9_PORTR|nr:hypothetical protein [Portunus trituberculatus]
MRPSTEGVKNLKKRKMKRKCTYIKSPLSAVHSGTGKGVAPESVPHRYSQVVPGAAPPSCPSLTTDPHHPHPPYRPLPPSTKVTHYCFPSGCIKPLIGRHCFYRHFLLLDFGVNF